MKPVNRRYALYTRKSSEERLDQELNSLDAQREACAAYVRSQSGEGWKALPAVHDDGGLSGGTMDRPALRQLLADVAAGRIDVIVVYKIDRLSRSLADFVRMFEIFDRHGVSFVSVTQAFSTSTSMGRLTLNVLLSFAQFEREVTGGRVRAKIAASEKKGMWMGGILPLGYDRPATGSRTLLVNEGEAATVRHVFASYLAHTSVHALKRQSQQEGVVSKRRVTGSGKATGGLSLSRGALFHLLRNWLDLGEIPHREMCHPGLHEAIIDRALFEAVQQKLDAHVRRRAKARETVAHAPLTGRIFDADGQVMSPAFAYGRGGKLYRYYVTASLQQGGRRAKGDEAPRRVSAAALDARRLATLGRLLTEHSGPPLLLITRVELHATRLELLPIRSLARMRSHLLPGESADADPADPSQLRLSLPVRFRTRGGHTEINGGAPAASKPDTVLIKAPAPGADPRHPAVGRSAAVLGRSTPGLRRTRSVRPGFRADHRPDLRLLFLVDHLFLHLLRPGDGAYAS